MKQSWKTQHKRDLDVWNEHLQQRRTSPEREGSGRENTAVTPPNTTTPVEDETPEWLNKPTPSFLDIRPAWHILKKLKKKEFVELWHFTAQGCRDAASIDLATLDDTFGLINTEKGLMLQTVGASSRSSKVVKDENLSWELLTEGKTRLITCMRTHGWSTHEVTELVKLFVNLDIHPIHSQEYGLQAVKRYQEMVRQNWTAALKIGNPYAIGTINEDLMKECQRKIAMELQAKNNVSTQPQGWIIKTLTIFPEQKLSVPFCSCTHRTFSLHLSFSAPAPHLLHLLHLLHPLRTIRTNRTCSVPIAPTSHQFHPPRTTRTRSNCHGDRRHITGVTKRDA